MTAGTPGSSPRPGMSDLSLLVSGAAAACGDRAAVTEAGGRTLTWAGLEDEVSRVATGLAGLGAVAGRRVLACLPNRLELAVVHLAALRAQAVSVPVDPRASAEDLARTVEDSGARVLVGDASTAEPLRAAASRAGHACAVVLIDGVAGPGETAYDEVLATEARPVPPLPDPDKLAALLYTGGTSGRPRAAMLTHRALLANLDQVAAVDPPMIGPDDVVLCALPLFHVYGLNAVLGGVLRRRARLVLADRFHPRDTLDLVASERVTVLPLAPPAFDHWLGVPGLRERLASVRLVLSGSAALPAEVVEAFRAETGLAVHQGYGLTEAAPVVTSTLCADDPPAGSVGAALPGVALRLTDAGGGEPVPGDPGEISVRGDNLFSGYWPDGADGPDDDGWWATGDLGLLDAAGNLFLVDRVEEVVVVSGFSVYPHEVEEVLADVEGVTAAGVIGVPDGETGQAVVAYVVAPDREPAGVVAAAAAACAERLAAFKRPVRVEVVERLPQTPTGRVQKGRLRGLERRRERGLIE